MSEIEYSVGIDFGHGETCVSRIPGYDGEAVSRIPLVKSEHDSRDKVMSAVCRSNDGRDRFVLPPPDFLCSDLYEGFKTTPAFLEADPEKKSAYIRFARLVFRTILDNDPDLHYSPETGEGNFAICVACPTKWRKEDPNVQDAYMDFFRSQCGIAPVSRCIDESYAAFVSRRDNFSPDDTVLVIDLGSGTVDFSTFHNSECVDECCWGANLGAHMVEDLIVAEGYRRNSENVFGMFTVSCERGVRRIGSADRIISIIARMAKEEFFTNISQVRNPDDVVFSINSTVRELTGADNDAPAFYLALRRPEFMNVIKEYVHNLSSEFSAAAIRLGGCHLHPTRVLLSGSASRMGFVSDLARNAFPDSEVKVDEDHPEFLVSDGTARYLAGLLGLGAHQSPVPTPIHGGDLPVTVPGMKEYLDQLAKESLHRKFIIADRKASGDLIGQMWDEVIADFDPARPYCCMEIADRLRASLARLRTTAEFSARFGARFRLHLANEIPEVVKMCFWHAFDYRHDLVVKFSSDDIPAGIAEDWFSTVETVVDFPRILSAVKGGVGALLYCNIEKPRTPDEIRNILSHCRKKLSGQSCAYFCTLPPGAAGHFDTVLCGPVSLKLPEHAAMFIDAERAKHPPKESAE